MFGPPALAAMGVRRACNGPNSPLKRPFIRVYVREKNQPIKERSNARALKEMHW